MIKIGRFSFSFTALSAAVIAFCSAGIIGLSVYADSKEDYLTTGKEQIYILTNSWSSMERETTNLLVEPTSAANDKKWQYSVATFNQRLESFLSNPLTRELAHRNRFFDSRARDMASLWPTLKEKIEKSALEMTGYIESHKGTNANTSEGLLYQIGYLSAKDNQAAQTAELSRIIKDCRNVISNSRVRCTVILCEMNDIISDEISERVANLRLEIFILSIAIVISMVFFVILTQKENRLYQQQLEKLVENKTSEAEAERTKAETARIQTDQVNNQLVATVNHANILSQKAIEANNAKNEFMASVSHEIRTPMNAIMGFSEMLSEDNLTAAQKKHVGIIRESSKHLLELINDILDFSKIEAGKMSVEIIECGVEDILAGVESMMRPAAIDQGLEFKVVRNEPMADTIRTDPSRLKQCIINLIGNAIKFTEKGYVKLNVLCQQQNGKDVILFEVEDSGIGIVSDKLDRIFEPFAQADVSTTRIYGGTGLGLAITRNLVEMLGGHITVKSVKGKGSIFSLSIPTGTENKQAVRSAVSDGKKENGQLSAQDMGHIKLSGRILIAEDSPTNQTLIELLLRRMGIESVIVENGLLAVEKAAGGGFDLILMDIQMPVMNGFEATRQLRRNGVKIPIIALTACAMKGDDKKCFAAGCSDYLTKPVDKKKLAQTLAKYLPVEGAEKTSAAVPASVSATVTKQDVGEKPAETVLPDDGGEMEINFPLLLERIGDESLIDEIVPVFLKDNTERMEILSQAVSKNDAKEIKFYAHSVKGAAATIGAMKISELAKQLEIAARDDQQADYQAIFDEMRRRFNLLMVFLGRSDWKQIAQQSQSAHQQPQQQ
jgi:signal transduction histidine kinase/DNA-binding NarL/FixJ family response regulator/HPt (histidine-containing phosphotransfer) domain-containing protein